MKKIRYAVFLTSTLFSAGCTAQILERPEEYRPECSFSYQSPLMGDFSNGKFEIFDEKLLVDPSKEIIGSAHASIGMPKCDRSKWHCLIGVGAPLFLPKPYGQDLNSWRHDNYFYEFGQKINLPSKEEVLVMPLFVYSHKIKEAKVDEKMGLVGAYFFDAQMNLVGFSSRFSNLEGNISTLFINAYWLIGDKAPLDCY